MFFTLVRIFTILCGLCGGLMLPVFAQSMPRLVTIGGRGSPMGCITPSLGAFADS